MIIKMLLIGAALGFGLLLLRERNPGRHQLLRRLGGLGVMLAAIIAGLAFAGRRVLRRRFTPAA